MMFYLTEIIQNNEKKSEEKKKRKNLIIYSEMWKSEECPGDFQNSGEFLPIRTYQIQRHKLPKYTFTNWRKVLFCRDKGESLN